MQEVGVEIASSLTTRWCGALTSDSGRDEEQEKQSQAQQSTSDSRGDMPTLAMLQHSTLEMLQHSAASSDSACYASRRLEWGEWRGVDMNNTIMQHSKRNSGNSKGKQIQIQQSTHSTQDSKGRPQQLCQSGNRLYFSVSNNQPAASARCSTAGNVSIVVSCNTVSGDRGGNSGIKII